jgi:teichuronic acid biosynthesis glycosyltransferase TuaC
MFPCKRHPTSAVFFANLMRELAPKLDKLIVVTPRIYIPKWLTKIKKNWAKWHFDPYCSHENGMEIFRPFVLSLPGIKYLGINTVLMQLLLYGRIKKLIQKNSIDLLLGYNLIPEGIVATRLAKMFRLPVAYWAIGSDVNNFSTYDRLSRYLAKKSIGQSNLVITESKDLEDKVRLLYKKPANVKTFYKGIDVDNFTNLPHRHKLKQRYNLSKNKRYILFAGRIMRSKGIYELAEAFIAVSKKYSDFELILLGEEIERCSFPGMFKKAGIEEKVHFKGMVPYKEVAYYMRSSDLFVFPSWAEGVPNVVMEAMAIGLPVVASNADGIPEVLINGVTGLSVPARNVEKLAEAILQMIENKTLRESCIENAKKMIHERFNVKKNSSVLKSILRELVDAARS